MTALKLIEYYEIPARARLVSITLGVFWLT
jgi:hypothetical protein